MPKIQSSKGAFEGSLKGSCCVSKIEYPLLEQADSTELRYHPYATGIRIYSCNYRSSDLILGDFKRDWVKDDSVSAQLPSVSDSSRSTTTPLSIIDRQQYPSGFYQPMVPVEHTAIVILTAHILYGVSLL